MQDKTALYDRAGNPKFYFRKLELVRARKQGNACPIGPAIKIDFSPGWWQPLHVVDCRHLRIKQPPRLDLYYVAYFCQKPLLKGREAFPKQA
jgi:hypothetical protein